MSSPSSRIRAAVDRAEAEDHIDQLGLAVALHASDADHLATADLDVDALEQGTTADAVEADTFDRELDLVGHRRLTGLRCGQLAAHHQLGQLAGRDDLRVDRGDRAPGPQDRDRVGDLQHLVELVGDEQDRLALGLQLPQVGEELLDLLGHEDGRRLVEDQDAGTPEEDLDDLDPLAHADAECADQLVRVDIQPIGLGQRGDALGGVRPVDAPQRRGLAAEDDVLGDRQLVGQHEVLVDHADAGVDGVLRGLERSELAVDLHHALVGRLHPVEDLHQRGLARPVLADERMDLAARDLQVDPVVGNDAREPLDDALQLDGDRLVRFHRPPSCPQNGDGPGHPSPGPSPGFREASASEDHHSGAVGTSISPSMICCLRSSSWSMTSCGMKSPLVE